MVTERRPCRSNRGAVTVTNKTNSIDITEDNERLVKRVKRVVSDTIVDKRKTDADAVVNDVVGVQKVLAPVSENVV